MTAHGKREEKYSEGNCWSCQSPINYHGSRKIRVAGVSEQYPQGCEAAVCSRPQCHSYADIADRSHGKPTQPDWPLGSPPPSVAGLEGETMGPTPLGPIATGDQRLSPVEELCEALRVIRDHALCEDGETAAQRYDIIEACRDVARSALSAHQGRRSPVVRSEEGNGTGPQLNLTGIKCRHGCAQAHGVFYLPDACPCFEDRIQPLCKQHEIKLRNNGYPVIELSPPLAGPSVGEVEIAQIILSDFFQQKGWAETAMLRGLRAQGIYSYDGLDLRETARAVLAALPHPHE